MEDDFLKANANNIKGFYEDKKFWKFGVKILKYNKVEWIFGDNRITIPDHLYIEGKKLVELTSKNNKQWGCKIPWFSLFLEMWHSI